MHRSPSHNLIYRVAWTAAALLTTVLTAVLSGRAAG
jgi:hypothetical protein